MDKECLTCNEIFTVYKSSNKKYCSRRCFEQRRKPTTCLGCGIEFYIPGEPNLKYHNKECFDKNGRKGTFKKGHTLNLGRNHTNITKLKQSQSRIGNKVSEVTKVKMSQTAIKRVHNHNLQKYGKWAPNYNANACYIIEEYGKINGYNFIHALNGGEYYIKELGYWVDGYDSEKNVVIEYYENHHQNKKQKEKDERRKREIIQALKCKFIIIYYNKNIEIWE